MKKVAALAVFIVCFSLSYVTPAFSAWTTWWSGGYTDYVHRTDFTTERPIYVRAFYRNGETYDWFIDDSSFQDGDGDDWLMTVGGNVLDYWETDYDYYFNRIDIGYPPEPADSITVPANRPSGHYTVSWTASPTSGVTYTLEEATNSSFTSGLRTVVSGTTSLSAQISDRTDGLTYYYRVRAEDEDEHVSAWVPGANGCMISPWTPWWSQGPWAECLERWDFPDTRPIYIQLHYKDGSTGMWYIEDSYFQEGELEIDGSHFSYCGGDLNKHFNQIDIAYPPQLPGSLSVPTSSTTGDYTVSWGASQTSGVTYTLEEATDSSFTSGLRSVDNGIPALSYQISGRTEGTTYYYRVRADEENGHSSDWVSGTNGCFVSGSGWSIWWNGSYTDYVHRIDFPADRPINVRVFYRNGETLDWYVEDSYFQDGDGDDWLMTINGNVFDYWETTWDYYFNRIDIKYAN